jgi:histidine phosphotransferase ChpT
MEKKFNITEIVCTRISHDLIGNIGALANALELMEDDDIDFMEEIKSTLNFSSTVLMSRLKFFRMVFGLNNANLKNADTVRNISQNYVKSLNPHHPIDIDISPINGQSDLNRVIMLAVMLCSDIIVKGGKITIKTDSQQITTNVTSLFPLAQDKIIEINNIIKGIYPENLSQYAPLFYLQEMGATLRTEENNDFTLYIG